MAQLIVVDSSPEHLIQQHTKRYQKNASFGNCQNSQFWCTSSFGTGLGGSLAPKRVLKPMVFKMASSGDFQNSPFGCFRLV